MRAGAHGSGGLSQHAVAVDLAALRRTAPQLDEAIHDRRRRVRRDESAIERTDRRANDEVGADVGLQERAQHADLDGAEQTATAEHEGRSPRLHGPTLPRRSVPP